MGHAQSTLNPTDRKQVLDQIQKVIENVNKKDVEQSKKEKVAQTMGKIQDFVEGKINEAAMQQVMVDYIDWGKEGKFSAAVKNLQNDIAIRKYGEYKELVKAFLGNLKRPKADFNLSHDFQQIIKTASGYLGVIESNNCANFIGAC